MPAQGLDEAQQVRVLDDLAYYLDPNTRNRARPEGPRQLGLEDGAAVPAEPSITHELEVSKRGYRPWSSKFEVQPGQTMELPPLRLDLLESGFSLDSVPQGATVLIDDQPTGPVTPLRVTDLAPGEHHIRLELEGYRPWESSLQVTEGSVLELPNARLEASDPGSDAPVVSVTARSIPAGARVVVRGKRMGVTPTTFSYTPTSNKEVLLMRFEMDG